MQTLFFLKKDISGWLNCRHRMQGERSILFPLVFLHFGKKRPALLKQPECRMDAGLGKEQEDDHNEEALQGKRLGAEQASGRHDAQKRGGGHASPDSPAFPVKRLADLK